MRMVQFFMINRCIDSSEEIDSLRIWSKEHVSFFFFFFNAHTFTSSSSIAGKKNCCFAQPHLHSSLKTATTL